MAGIQAEAFEEARWMRSDPACRPALAILGKQMTLEVRDAA